MSVRDPFDEAYAAGVPRPVAAARQATTAEARRGTTGQVSTRARPTAGGAGPRGRGHHAGSSPSQGMGGRRGRRHQGRDGPEAVGRASPGHGWGHPAGSDRPARPPRVQRVRTVGAPEDVHQPWAVARRSALPAAGSRPVEPTDQGRHLRFGQEGHDPLRGGAGGGGRRHRHPGRIEGLPEQGRGPRPQRRPAHLRQPGGTEHRRLRPAAPRRHRRASSGASRPAPRRRTTSTSPKGRRATRRRSTSSSASPSRRCSAR